MSVKGEKKNLMVYLVMSYHVITIVSLALTSLIKYFLNIPSMGGTLSELFSESTYFTYIWDIKLI